MATDDPRDADDYFEALAGREGGGPGAQALRDALQAQARTLRDAEQARADELSDEERARMASLKQRLLAAGAFRPAPVPPRAPGWAERLLALAAGVLLASVLVLRLTLPGDDDDPSRTQRGKPSAVISVPDAAATAAALEARLRAAGAEVLRVQVNANEWSLEVRVPEASRVSLVQQLLREAGFAADAPPPYELSVRSRP